LRTFKLHYDSSDESDYENDQLQPPYDPGAKSKSLAQGRFLLGAIKPCKNFFPDMLSFEFLSNYYK
jgi:hypothetical protein